jgi:hypothetical protein
VMGGAEEASTHFHVHTLAIGPDGRLRLLAPERVDIGAAAPGGVH